MLAKCWPNEYWLWKGGLADEESGQVSTSIRNPFLVLWEFGKHHYSCRTKCFEHKSSFEVCDYVSQRNVGEDAASAEEMEKALHIMGFETEETMKSWPLLVVKVFGSRNCFNGDDELVQYECGNDMKRVLVEISISRKGMTAGQQALLKGWWRKRIDPQIGWFY